MQIIKRCTQRFTFLDIIKLQLCAVVKITSNTGKGQKNPRIFSEHAAPANCWLRKISQLREMRRIDLIIIV